MNIELKDDLSFRAAWFKFRKEWVLYHMSKGYNISELAKRSKTTRKTIRAILCDTKGKDEYNKDDLWTDSKCIFCGNETNIEDHHLDGKSNGNSTIMLCERCHTIFHSLNKRYRKPTK